MEANRGIRSGAKNTSGDQKTPQQGAPAQGQAPADPVTPSTAKASPAGASTETPASAQHGGVPRPPAVLMELKGQVAVLDADVAADWTMGETLAGLDALETVKRMIEARQAVLTAHVVEVRTQLAQKAERSVKNVRAEAGKVMGLCRRLNGSKARDLVDVAVDCPTQAPHTFGLWWEGKVSEEQALVLFRQTTLLTPAGRAEADETLATDLPNLGLAELRKRLDRVVAHLEPELVAERRRKAAENRRAGFTYRPDSMMNLNALIPSVAGQAMDTIISTYARSKRAGGDERTQDQLKADLLIALVIGWAKATQGVPDEFLKAHHIGCGGEPGQPCTQNHADNGSPEGQRAGSEANTDGDGDGSTPPCNGVDSGEVGSDASAGSSQPREPGQGYEGIQDDLFSRHDSDTSGDGASPLPDRSGELCAPTTGFADVSAMADLFTHLLPPDDGQDGENAGVGGPGAPVDPMLGLVLPAGVGVQINLVMTDLALFGISDTPAQLFGLGPVPAKVARELVHTAHARHAATLKRLYTEPVSGALVKMESKARTFPDGLGQMLTLRDGHCRFPFCDAPIKHLDHIHPHADGGPTNYSNGQGLCARHNLLKETNGAATYPEPVSVNSTEATESTGLVSGHLPTVAEGADSEPGHEQASAVTGEPDREVQLASPLGGGGAIFTRLSGGMKFTSPSRRLPAESPLTLAEDHYWRGYREGRVDQRQQQADREHELQRQEEWIYDADAKLRGFATRLAQKANGHAA